MTSSQHALTSTIVLWNRALGSCYGRRPLRSDKIATCRGDSGRSNMALTSRRSNVGCLRKSRSTQFRRRREPSSAMWLLRRGPRSASHIIWPGRPRRFSWPPAVVEVRLSRRVGQVLVDDLPVGAYDGQARRWRWREGLLRRVAPGIKLEDVVFTDAAL